MPSKKQHHEQPRPTAEEREQARQAVQMSMDTRQ